MGVPLAWAGSQPHDEVVHKPSWFALHQGHSSLPKPRHGGKKHPQSPVLLSRACWHEAGGQDPNPKGAAARGVWMCSLCAHGRTQAAAHPCGAHGCKRTPQADTYMNIV